MLIVTPVLALVLGAIFVQLDLVSASPANNQCAQFCAANFRNSGRQCTSLAAHGGGPCYACGPAAPPGHPDVCAGDCCASSTPNCCGSACTDLQTDVKNCGTCGKACSATQICFGGKCVCAGQTCDTPFMPGCHNNENCYCFQISEGGSACTGDFFCADRPICVHSSDCPSGTQCVVNTCCGEPICAIEECTPSTGPLVALTRAKTVSGTAAGK